MEFACNAYCFPHEEIDENAAAAAEAGFAGIEPSFTPEALMEGADGADGERVAAIEAAAEASAMAVPSVLSPTFWQYPLSSTDDGVRAEGLARGRRLIEAADALGAETVLVVPGTVDEDTRYDRAYENALAGVRELAGHADDHGVTLAVENVWNDMLYSPLEFRSFVEDAAEAGPVGAYFDAGNVVRFGYPEQWIRILDENIVAVHVKGYDENVDTGDGFTYPLAGTVDWGAVRDALADVGYDGWIAPEVPPYDFLPERTLPALRGGLGAIFD
jgi:hexulose-6-phosphate isomerase